MTQKELLYLEDAIGHERSIINICNIAIDNLDDEDFKTFMEDEVSHHQQMEEALMNLLKEKANG